MFVHLQTVLSQHAHQITSCALSIAVFPSPLCAMETRTAWMDLMRRTVVGIPFFNFLLTLFPKLYDHLLFLLFRVYLFFI